ncbi:16S rRNA pseudouridine(516) synthase [Candidatus Accumulibacter aalborgensis]|nr:pseudouridine synthase [Candidatus Accumulibacter aalborgensis]
MELERLLRSQGFGSRAECRALVCAQRVRVRGQLCDEPLAQFEPDGLTFAVDGESWTYRKFVYVALNKPAGYECSHRPQHHPSVYSLLPQALLRRGVQAVGRLDADTTGLLLMTDDGQFVHACTSPRKLVAKVYEVGTRHPVDDAQVAVLLNGVCLHDEPTAVAAAACERLDDRRLLLTVTLGKYHLVKRMLAAAGNRVESLHRLAIGGLALPPGLSPGHWMWLEADQLGLRQDFRR